MANTGSLSVVLPRISLAPGPNDDPSPLSSTVEVPPSMNEQDRAFLIGELGKLSTDYTKLSVRDEEREKALHDRFKRLEARIGKIEDKAEASGQHNIVRLESALVSRDADASRRRDRIASVVVTFLITAILALVGFYLKSLGG